MRCLETQKTCTYTGIFEACQTLNRARMRDVVSGCLVFSRRRLVSCSYVVICIDYIDKYVLCHRCFSSSEISLDDSMRSYNA